MYIHGELDTYINKGLQSFSVDQLLMVLEIGLPTINLKPVSK